LLLRECYDSKLAKPSAENRRAQFKSSTNSQIVLLYLFPLLNLSGKRPYFVIYYLILYLQQLRLSGLWFFVWQPKGQEGQQKKNVKVFDITGNAHTVATTK